jgi:hypothetical protein
VSKLRLWISMSLDGFVAGPSQSMDNPLGIGGTRPHEWAFPLTVWRAMHGLPGEEVTESTPVVEEARANIGATVMGRNMFGGHPGPSGKAPDRGGTAHVSRRGRCVAWRRGLNHHQAGGASTAFQRDRPPCSIAEKNM